MYCTSNLHLSDVTLDLSHIPLDRRSSRLLKRTLDVLLAGFALVLLLPLLALIGLAIWGESTWTRQGGGVFYRQERVSRQGKVFGMYKFRTMNPQAEAQSGPVWAQRDDGRTTHVGQFLRRASLDELPQLWNVCKGDMSLVGPRPERPFFVTQFSEEIPGYAQRHQVKAGLTGWAQIHGLRGDTSLEQRVAHDLYYIQHWSLGLDLRILWRTFAVVLYDFKSRRAY